MFSCVFSVRSKMDCNTRKEQADRLFQQLQVSYEALASQAMHTEIMIVINYIY